MSDQGRSPASGGGVTVPPETAAKHPELIDLILHSESMNDEERQYWIDILPVMTDEQITQLRDILQNEREQLAAIDKKYGEEIKGLGDQSALRHMEEERKEKQERLRSKEQEARDEESKKADDILKNMD